MNYSEGNASKKLSLIPMATPTSFAEPCSSCPWRCDQTAADIPGFELTMAEGLSTTCPDTNNQGPAWNASWFACHQSASGKEVACRGWLAQVGHAHPRVRLAVLRGELSPEALAPAADWPPLPATYPEVLAKLKATKASPPTKPHSAHSPQTASSKSLD